MSVRSARWASALVRSVVVYGGDAGRTVLTEAGAARPGPVAGRTVVTEAGAARPRGPFPGVGTDLGEPVVLAFLDKVVIKIADFHTRDR